MNLDRMQNLLNGLEAFFKIFVYPKQEEITLRVFYDVPAENPEYKDIIYDMKGNFIR